MNTRSINHGQHIHQHRQHVHQVLCFTLHSSYLLCFIFKLSILFYIQVMCFTLYSSCVSYFTFKLCVLFYIQVVCSKIISECISYLCCFGSRALARIAINTQCVYLTFMPKPFVYILYGLYGITITCWGRAKISCSS